MSEKSFDPPRLAINRVYTRRGDSGETSLVCGQRRLKDDLRIEAYGAVDELNSFVGLALESARELRGLAEILRRVQHELFNLGSVLATLPEDLHPKQPRITAEETAQLEREMDRMNEGLAPLRSFVLPGGSRLNAELHICRTVCRRAERVCVTLAGREPVDPEIVKYLNRLSDALFVWSRWASRELGTPENLWDPNAAASGHHPAG
ncbi:MAG TPA: cob(I)yrinic acid a,c-diamide adenosyltransferase [Bryobacteraceae bacterium]|jgi:cob(I)alamin adenosyltransferase|nr:cob(I)yrinic acid a,c-diamide adenosyltransferase [Bryobacteraceae bacterium]